MDSEPLGGCNQWAVLTDMCPTKLQKKENLMKKKKIVKYITIKINEKM